MKLSVSSVQEVLAQRPVADVVVLPFFAGTDGAQSGPGAAELGLDGVVERMRLRGRTDEQFWVAGRDGDAFGAALFVGLGPQADMDADVLRQAMVAAVRGLRRFPRIVTWLAASSDHVPSDRVSSDAAAEAVAEGALLGSYTASDLKADGDDPLRIEDVLLVVGAQAAVPHAQKAVERAEITCSSVNWARMLIDRPAAELTPMLLAREMQAMGEANGLDVRVLDAAALRDGGFGGLLAVGAGSVNPPCLVEARYVGADQGTAASASAAAAGGGRRTVGLVGKGITFDSGGLMVKSKAGMGAMRIDMAGAVTMLAATQAVARLGGPVDVIALAPLAENMPSGTAYRPGDVITHRGGITSEVVDTDAEGRVVLADALAYMAEQAPDAIVDAATLTYDVVHALGTEITGILGNDQALVDRIMAAGAATGEPFWQLPLWRRYRRNIDSPVAAVRNDGFADADAIHAALFLDAFVAGVPWAHLDIAGTAYVEEATDRDPIGATGACIRTLVHWLTRPDD